MKTNPRARARVSGIVAIALVGTAVGVAGMGVAVASTEVVAAPLSAPTGLTPDDSNVAYPHVAVKNVRLDWAPVAGATGYTVEVGRDDTWSTDPVFTKNVLYSELTLPVSLPNATYVWRVAARKGTQFGHWSSEAGQAHSDAEFTKGWHVAPTLTPITTFLNRPTYAWSPVAGASGYQVQVSKDPFTVPSATGSSGDTTPGAPPQGQATSLLTNCFTPRTQVTPYSDVLPKTGSGSVGACGFGAPADGTTVYWRVRALDAFVGAADDSAMKPVSEAGVTYLPPGTSEADRDCPGYTLSDCAPKRASALSLWSAASSFDWNPVAPTDLQVEPMATTSLGLDPSCTVSNPAGPQAEHAVCTDVPTISWKGVAGAARYRLTFARDAAFSNIQNVVETSALTWTSAGSWADASAQTSYYYVVQACTASGCGAVTATPPSFSKVTPRPTVGAVPPKTGEMKLTWQSYAAALSNATGSPATQDAFVYHVQVAKSDHPTYDVLVDDVLVDETYLSPAKSYGDGSFVWRVQPIDSAGNRLPFSLSRPFTRDATPPRVVSVTPSANVAVKAPLKLVFSEPVTGLSSSSVRLSPAAATTLSVTSSTTATLVPTTGLRPGATYTVLVSSTVKDLAGNSALTSGPTLTVNPFVDDKSTALGYTGTWHLLSSSNALGGTYHGAVPTATSHPYASLSFTGTAVSLTACVGPSYGYVDLYLDGVKKTRVSTYRSFSGCGVKVAALTGITRAVHSFKVVGVGAHASGSTGNGIGVDAISVTP